MTGVIQYANSEAHKRTIHPNIRNRRKCHCGCGGRAMFAGAANGICMMTGCELSVRILVRDGIKAIIRRRGNER